MEIFNAAENEQNEHKIERENKTFLILASVFIALLTIACGLYPSVQG